MLPEGHRLHVVLEGISRGFSAVNIRKFVVRAAALHDLVSLGSLSPRAASFLDASVRAGLNILVDGGAGGEDDVAPEASASTRHSGRNAAAVVRRSRQISGGADRSGFSSKVFRRWT